MKKPCSATDPLWYKDAVIYEIHVRAFADSNADGIGDFQGLISKLDYLQELGVTCLWLLPFFPSPLRDDGYDIADYTSVNPSYGTIADFQEFLDQAHARNLQVMIELVINHTSDQHPWFQKARHAPKGSPERNLYVWSDTDKLYDGVRIIFTDTEKSNWTWDDVAQQYYWHRFFSHQPDLNFDNPQVMEEVLNAMRFWMDMGVDGLRLDAIPYLVERDGTSCENVPETHVKIKQIRAAIDAEYENRLVLAEANMWPADVRPYFGDGDECNMAFHFPLMPRIYMALRQEDRLPITDIMAQTPAIPDNCQWGLFLRNHDELTLEMVTDDERDYMNLAYAADTRMRINVGIRRRLAPLMDNNRRRIELLNSLLLSFPGTPIMYYGDEIGMGDNIYLGDRNGVRTPMQWNSDRNAGFSRAVPAKLYFPVIMDPIWGYQAINVEAQESDPSSLLHWTRNMIALRKIFQVFGRGTLEFLHPENRKVLAYIREYTGPDGHNETVLCVANLSRFAQPVQLDLSKYTGRQPIEMLGYVPFPLINETPYAITLAPYSFFWLELQPAAARPVLPTTDLTDTPAIAPPPAEITSNPVISSEAPSTTVISPEAAPTTIISTEAERLHVLRSGEIPALPPAQNPSPATTQVPRGFSLESHTPEKMGALAPGTTTVTILSLLQTQQPTIESLLPAYIATQRWFGGKSRTIHSTRIASTTPVQQADAVLALIEVTYDDNTIDIYQLPLALAAPDQAEKLQTSAPKSVIATLHNAVLYDASASPAFQQGLLHLITGNPAQAPGVPGPASGTQDSTDLVATHSSAIDLKRLEDVPSRLSSAEQSNTSILYDDIAILKLFRRLNSDSGRGTGPQSTGENPDVEIARFLTEVAHFQNIPAYLGDLHLSSDNTTLAFLQSFAPNDGDGWAWTLEELSRFFASVAGTPAPTPPSPPSPPDFKPFALPHTLSSRPGAASFAAGAERPASAPAHASPATNQLPLNSNLGSHSREEAQEPVATHAAPFLAAAELIGRRTAELHLALATPTDDSAFAAEPFTEQDLQNEAERIDLQLKTGLNALENARKTLPEDILPVADELLTQRESLYKTVDALTGDPTLFGQRIRIHGDYHLGQLLHSKNDFLIVDFEGEPARSLEERRRKQSPLRDVAGMLRSFSYAAHSALQIATLQHPADTANLKLWAKLWETAAANAFLRGYTTTIAATPHLFPTGEYGETLLRALLLEKAFYELLYELNNRPTWLVIPLTGILALTQNGA